MIRLLCILLVCLTALVPTPAAAAPPLVFATSSRVELEPGDQVVVTISLYSTATTSETLGLHSYDVPGLLLTQTAASGGTFVVADGYPRDSGVGFLAWTGPAREGQPVTLWLTYQVDPALPADGRRLDLVYTASSPGGQASARVTARVGTVTWQPIFLPYVQKSG
jgi:hypothetical protein